MVSVEGWGLGEVRKRRKSLKVGGVGPRLRGYKGFVVVVRRWCGVLEG